VDDYAYRDLANLSDPVYKWASISSACSSSPADDRRICTPLWFVHRRLVSEKLRLLAEIHRRVESTSNRLYLALDKNEMVEAVQFSNALNGLNIERNVLSGSESDARALNSFTQKTIDFIQKALPGRLFF